ncbi:MAG TPA: SPASM domain-containing protein [Phnomibacter sp.]|nr:SPASM domain-containing protein [Phnomibacter sp.]
MYQLKDYLARGATFINNTQRSRHKKLSTLMVYATDLCDSACKHCLIWTKRPVQYLAPEKIFEVMQAKCITPRTSVGLEGGEFLLHPQWPQIMEWFVKHHKNFDLLSNCLQPQTTIEAVKKYPPRRLYVSLDGTPETYHHMRGKDGYDGVIKVLENCSKIVPASVMFTLSPYNDFTDLEHVAQVCKRLGIDLRVGIYNDIAFFDTLDKAHQTQIGQRKDGEPLTFSKVKAIRNGSLTARNGNATQPANPAAITIPQSIHEFAENYDFLVLYEHWKQGGVKLKCYSILDSLVILPNGDVPLCQNLDLKIGNIHQHSLDEIFNGPEAIKTQQEYVHNCNACWLNFHRKYDVVLYRSFEKYFGRWVTTKLLGYYQWSQRAEQLYKQTIEQGYGG